MTRTNTINNSGLFLDTIHNKNVISVFCVFIQSVTQTHLGTGVKTSFHSDQIKQCRYYMNGKEEEEKKEKKKKSLFNTCLSCKGTISKG